MPNLERRFEIATGSGSLSHTQRFAQGADVRNRIDVTRGAVPRRPLPHDARINVVRYRLYGNVLPLVTETLPVAETARRALMSWQGRLTESGGIRGRSDILSGKNEDGQRLAGHGHAYYVPTDEDGDGHLDHLTVYAAGGFGPDEQRAVNCVQKLRMGEDGRARSVLRVVLLALGAIDDYRLGPLGASKVWVAATPYLATRYAKTRGRSRIDLNASDDCAAFLEADMRAQLAAVRPDLARDGIVDVAIEPQWDNQRVFLIGGQWRPTQFKRMRRRAGGRWRQAARGRIPFDLPRTCERAACPRLVESLRARTILTGFGRRSWTHELLNRSLLCPGLCRRGC